MIFPNVTVVVLTTKHPIAPVPIGGEIGAEISRCLNISNTCYDGEYETPPAAVHDACHEVHAGAGVE